MFKQFPVRSRTLAALSRVAVALTTIAALALTVAAPVRGEDGLPHFGHVFIIVLENEGYNTTFGPDSKAPYLSQTLVSKGVLLSQYYGTGHASNDNYVSMISGQAGTPQNHNDCIVYGDFVRTGVTPDGQAIGSGCIYPASIKTLPDQLTEVGKTWRAYMGDMGNDPSRESATCGHPALNTVDMTQSAEKPSATLPNGDQYATRHNPFVYFHSIIDSSACQAGVVNLNQLPVDLKSEESTPNFVFVTPNLCEDGHDAPCVTGAPGGLVSADAFLQKWIPMIQASEAYKRDGLIIVTFDEGGYTLSVSSTGGITIAFQGQTCCSEQPGPNLGSCPTSSTFGSYTLTYGSYGGDQTGAVLLSPLLKPGPVSNVPFNHYSMLKSLEDNFGTKSYLGYAGQPGLISFFGSARSDIQTVDEEH